MPRLFLLLTVMAAACGGKIREDKFPDKAAKVLCPLIEECALGYYQKRYSAKEGLCEQGVRKDFRELALSNNDADCTYNEEEAAECLKAIDDMECDAFWVAFDDDYAEVCGGMWSCPE